ncbi:MAG: SOSS complex subunit B family protein [Candidatus Woesearchaeota archaeon]|nr:SOSS complex subunit B family protein [Candidatus Woesearchaeota archaeon]
MPIADLKAGQGKVDLTVDITEKGDVRTFAKFGKEGRVCNATAKDASGEIKLSLWNEQVDQVNVGDKIKITNGYVSEWQGEKQLSTGKFGTLEVVSKGAGAAPAESEPAPKAAKSEEDDLFEEETV